MQKKNETIKMFHIKYYSRYSTTVPQVHRLGLFSVQFPLLAKTLPHKQDQLLLFAAVMLLSAAVLVMIVFRFLCLSVYASHSM